MLLNSRNQTKVPSSELSPRVGHVASLPLLWCRLYSEPNTFAPYFCRCQFLHVKHSWPPNSPLFKSDHLKFTSFISSTIHLTKRTMLGSDLIVKILIVVSLLLVSNSSELPYQSSDGTYTYYPSSFLCNIGSMSSYHKSYFFIQQKNKTIYHKNVNNQYACFIL